MENLTPEQIAQSISAAFDSANLINQLETKETLTDEEVSIYNRNVEHLRIMMAKEWFANGLTPEQETSINSLI